MDESNIRGAAAAANGNGRTNGHVNGTNGHHAKYRYLRLSLSRLHLRECDRSELAHLGVECVDDGRDYEAYGIIVDSSRVATVAKISRLDWIADVDFGEPPCSA